MNTHRIVRYGAVEVDVTPRHGCGVGECRKPRVIIRGDANGSNWSLADWREFVMLVEREAQRAEEDAAFDRRNTEDAP